MSESATLSNLASMFQIQITAKGSRTFFINSKRDCYVCGCNTSGQLGLNPRNEIYNLTLLTLPNNEKISFISCGDAHVICLTENSLCYVWGNNSFGQLGLGDINYRLTPTLLTPPNNEKITHVTCGYLYSVCLTANKSCYVWGANISGQLGLGLNANTSYREPTLLNLQS